jgi:hypothetical protein
MRERERERERESGQNRSTIGNASKTRKIDDCRRREKENEPNRSQGCQERFVCSWGRVVMGTVVIGQSLGCLSLFFHLSIFSTLLRDSVPLASLSYLGCSLNFVGCQEKNSPLFCHSPLPVPPATPSGSLALSCSLLCSRNLDDVRKHVLMRF